HYVPDTCLRADADSWHDQPSDPAHGKSGKFSFMRGRKPGRHPSRSAPGRYRSPLLECPSHDRYRAGRSDLLLCIHYGLFTEACQDGLTDHSLGSGKLSGGSFLSGYWETFLPSAGPYEGEK